MNKIIERFRTMTSAPYHFHATIVAYGFSTIELCLFCPSIKIQILLWRLHTFFYRSSGEKLSREFNLSDHVLMTSLTDKPLILQKESLLGLKGLTAWIIKQFQSDLPQFFNPLVYFQHYAVNYHFLLSHITYSRDGENFLICQRNSC